MPGIGIAELRSIQDMPPLPDERAWDVIDSGVYQPIVIPRAPDTPDELLDADYRFPDEITREAQRVSSPLVLPVDPSTRLPRNPRGATGAKGGHLWKRINQSGSGIVLRRGHVLLVQQRATGLWTPPGGFEEPADHGDARNTILREILEEAGVALDKSVRFDAVNQSMPDDPRDTDDRWVAETTMRADVSHMPVSALHPKHCGAETNDAQWVPLQKAPLDEMSSYFANQIYAIQRELGVISMIAT